VREIFRTGATMKIMGLRATLALAGLVALCGVSRASMVDAQIAISKAVNSSTITVHYEGTRASMAELVLNGVSIGTRSLNSNSSTGESDFQIDPATLQTGKNVIEIRLFNQSGKIVGTKSTVITKTQVSQDPFSLSSPLTGSSVQGPIQISVNLNQTFESPYVSFFVDNKLRWMSNAPPFTYLWDTTSDSNGWHSIQSWLVDNSSTLKSNVIKVFVNNPGGLTPRKNQAEGRQNLSSSILIQAKPGSPTIIAKPDPVIKPNQVAMNIPVLPVIQGILSLNSMRIGLVSTPRGLKSVQGRAPVEAGAKHLLPTGERLALTAKTHRVSSNAKSLAGKSAVLIGKSVKPGSLPKLSAIESTANALRFLAIENGTRIPFLPNFMIFLNGSQVNFDVQPTVDNGVPMTPLRYLLEKDGGKVGWTNFSKTVTATDRGLGMWLQIGNNVAKIDKKPLKMEKAPYIRESRTIVPLSFIHDALHVNVQYDKKTEHVLITEAKK